MSRASADHPKTNRVWCPSRREFIRTALRSAAGAALIPATGLIGIESVSAFPTTADARALTPARLPSRVVRITDQRIIPVRIVQRSLLKDYLSEGLRRLTGTETVADAWRDILAPDDVILIKFNQSGRRQIGTSPALAAELVDSLVRSGWAPERIMLLEVGEFPSKPHKTKVPDHRWQGSVVDFGVSGKDSFLAALDQATAIINVPFLKTHHLATMTCCLKNLSHGLIRHPARFHGNGCDPAIGEIVASAPIQRKLKLNIVNGLRIVFDGGPEAGASETDSVGTLLLGRDPVACDAIGYGILNEIRSLHQLGPLLPGSWAPRQLLTAARLGVGQFDVDAIDLQDLRN